MGNKDSKQGNVEKHKDGEVEDSLVESVLCLQDDEHLWTIRKFFDEDEESYLTEFEHECTSEETTVFLQRSIDALKQMRHPNVVKYLSSQVEPSKLYMLTECVVPAKVALEKMSSVEAVVGLKDVAKGLDFMLNRLGMAHNNLHLGAVFVGDTSQQWKLAGMEGACPLDQVDQQFLSSLASIRASDATPPEDESPSPSGGEPRPQARDVWALGQLVLAVNEELKEDDALPEDLVEYAHTVLSHEDPSKRPTVLDLLSHRLLNSDFCQVIEVLADFVLKTEEEKMEFTQSMFLKLMPFPEEAVCGRLLPVLLTPPVVADPLMMPLWNRILIPKSENPQSVSGFFTEECFRNAIVPEIIELFHSREKRIRTFLLQHFDIYAGLFSLEELQEFVLPEVLVGLQENDSHIVAYTLKAISLIIPLLGADVVMGTTRSTVFTDTVSTPSDQTSTSESDLVPENTSEGESSVAKPEEPEVVEVTGTPHTSGAAVLVVATTEPSEGAVTAIGSPESSDPLSLQPTTEGGREESSDPLSLQPTTEGSREESSDPLSLQPTTEGSREESSDPLSLQPSTEGGREESSDPLSLQPTTEGSREESSDPPSLQPSTEGGREEC